MPDEISAYLAAPIFNEEQLEVVSHLHSMLTSHGCEVFSPYAASREIWKGRAPKDCTPDERAQVLRGNVEHLRWCNLLVAWLGGTDNGKTDTGVVWEMGYAGALSQTPAMYEGRPLHGGEGKHRFEWDDNEPEREVYVPGTPFTLGYVHPTDKRQGKDVNLMLAGTMDAVVCGEGDFHQAISGFKKLGASYVHRVFNPNKLVGHEEASTT